MSDKLVLIDGHSILNRAFYGVPDLSNAEGLHTNAVYGFLNILLRSWRRRLRAILPWPLTCTRPPSGMSCTRNIRGRGSPCRRS